MKLTIETSDVAVDSGTVYLDGMDFARILVASMPHEPVRGRMTTRILTRLRIEIEVEACDGEGP